MRILVPVLMLAVALSGCAQDSHSQERDLERAEKELAEARKEAEEALRDVRQRTEDDLRDARRQAEEKLAEAREQLDRARERMRDASEDLEREWSDSYEREAERSLEELGVAETIGRVMEDVGRALQDEETAVVADAEALRDLLPNEVLGLERYNSNMDQSGKWGLHVSQAEAKYADGHKRIELKIIDLGTLKGFLSKSESLLDSISPRYRDNHHSRTTRIAGYPARISHRENHGTDEFDGILVVRERFVIAMDARGQFDEDVFSEVIDDLPLRRLERMAQ
ncbi:MAG: hypothetical protein JJ896_13635 [Rhodothermales bacterium]|nr:hypothetical protein [Rhodothermales bacterium]MBO6780690.1 hypothetical protein [Rhodothermales bacterium]